MLMEATNLEQSGIDAQKRVVLDLLYDAWAEASSEGVDSDVFVHAALFIALAEMVETYGETAVSELAATLPTRIPEGRIHRPAPLSISQHFSLPIRALFDLTESDRRSIRLFLPHNLVDLHFIPVGLCSSAARSRHYQNGYRVGACSSLHSV